MGRHVAGQIYLILYITYGDECMSPIAPAADLHTFRTMFVSDLQ